MLPLCVLADIFFCLSLFVVLHAFFFNGRSAACKSPFFIKRELFLCSATVVIGLFSQTILPLVLGASLPNAEDREVIADLIMCFMVNLLLLISIYFPLYKVYHPDGVDWDTPDALSTADATDPASPPPMARAASSPLAQRGRVRSNQVAPALLPAGGATASDTESRYLLQHPAATAARRAHCDVGAAATRGRWHGVLQSLSDERVQRGETCCSWRRPRPSTTSTLRSS